MDHPIVAAIKSKLTLGFVYQGQTRFVAPYMLGKTDKGKLVLHGLQTGGTSSEGPVTEPVWKFFYLDKMESVSVLDIEWAPTLAKTEAEYTPPKFIVEVLALVEL